MRLEPMDAREAERFLAGAAERFVDELVRSAELSRVEAEARTRDVFGRILPQGAATRGQHFRHLRAGGARVGTLWFAEQLAEDPPRVFVYDIVVHADARGQGHGTAAFDALEEEARGLGARQIMLSVRSRNTGAIRLYERLGFMRCERGAAGMRMAKALG